jgi:hypothetical protein
MEIEIEIGRSVREMHVRTDGALSLERNRPCGRIRLRRISS